MDHEMKALKAFADATDALCVFRYGSRPTNPTGEQVDCFSERDDEPAKYAKFQRARDELVRAGVLDAVR